MGLHHLYQNYGKICLVVESGGAHAKIYRYGRRFTPHDYHDEGREGEQLTYTLILANVNYNAIQRLELTFVRK